MASIVPSEEAVKKYCQWIKRVCAKDPKGIPLWPGYTALADFVEDGAICKKPPGISIVSIPSNTRPKSEFSIMHMIGPQSLFENLSSSSNNIHSSQLIIIENICPNTLTTLGAMYDIDPQFFAEHVNVLSWYNMLEKIPERLLPLPSTKKEEDFLTLRYVETRKLDLLEGASVYAKSILWPNPRHTRLTHSAGKLEPISRPGRADSRIAFSRQTVSVWSRKKLSGSGWIAIMLLDPPFRLLKKYGTVGGAEYRDPSLRPKTQEECPGHEKRLSFRLAFCDLLSRRSSADSMYLKTCATDVFLVLYEGYRIIASEWLVVNEYVKRQLADIEFHLEKSESTFLQLEAYLKELYRIRRRCNKDRELVMEAATQCKNRGQALWPAATIALDGTKDVAKIAEDRAQDLVEDLQFVVDNMNINISRVEKNISLLMGLVTIHEGRQGLQENRAILFLTFIAIIFLPSETVATILGMQTQYGPGADSFWLLWALALPLTVIIITIPYLYRKASVALKYVWPKCLHASSRRIPDQVYGIPDEGIELSEESIEMSNYLSYQVSPVPPVPQMSMDVSIQQV